MPFTTPTPAPAAIVPVLALALAACGPTTIPVLSLDAPVGDHPDVCEAPDGAWPGVDARSDDVLDARVDAMDDVPKRDAPSDNVADATPKGDASDDGDAAMRDASDDREVDAAVHDAPADVADVPRTLPELDALNRLPTDEALAPPRLLEPLATALTTTRAPTLRWRYPSEGLRSVVLLCADRACDVPEALFEATGQSWTAPGPLTPGVHFWRVLQVGSGVRGARWSLTWSLRVGPRDAPHAANHGHAADYNCDGYSDLAMPAREVGGPVGVVFVYFGGRDGLPGTPSQALYAAADPGRTTFRSASFDLDAGDLNGDGCSELAIAARFGSTNPYVNVYLGGAAGLTPYPVRQLVSPIPQLRLHGYAITWGGDVNRDGFGDLFVTDPGVPETFDDERGWLHVYEGGPGGVADAPTYTSRYAIAESRAGAGLAPGGDFNADGNVDLVVTAPGRLDARGAFKALTGDGTRFNIETPGYIGNPVDCCGSRLGVWAGMADDINGDGYSDAVISQNGFAVRMTGMLPVTYGGTRFLTWAGGATPFGAAATFTTPAALANTPYREHAAVGGDLNGDGFSDLAAPASTGEIHVFYGSPTGFGAEPGAVIPFAQANVGVSIAHDFNRDGYSDLYATGHVFLGGAGGPARAPTTVLSCAAGSVRCGLACFDLRTDDANCGACGTRCTLPQRCVASRCM